MSRENVEIARRIWEDGVLFDDLPGALDADFEVHAMTVWARGKGSGVRVQQQGADTFASSRKRKS